jgi:hypothetical protein
MVGLGRRREAARDDTLGADGAAQTRPVIIAYHRLSIGLSGSAVMLRIAQW